MDRRPGWPLQRFFVAPEAIANNQVEFSEEISHQISQVLRLDVSSSQVIVLDGSGKSYLARLTGRTGKKVSAEIIETLIPEPENQPNLTLCFSLTRREKVEWILQKCTEIGVDGFRPFISSRSLNRESVMDAQRRQRWESIIREAAEQSERVRLPLLMDPLPFSQLLTSPLATAQRLIAYEFTSPELTLRTVPLCADDTLLIIGPEGGFTPEEVDAALNTGFQTFSLGRRVLRMETACMVASALVLDRMEAIAVDCG